MTLAQLAAAHGVATSYDDWSGTSVPVAPTAVVAALAALGVDADGDEAVAHALEDAAQAPWRRLLPPTVVDQIRLWQIEGERMDVHSGFLIKDVGSAEDYERAVRYADALGVLKKEFRNKGWFFVSRMDQMSTYFKGLSARRREAQMAAR